MNSKSNKSNGEETGRECMTPGLEPKPDRKEYATPPRSDTGDLRKGNGLEEEREPKNSPYAFIELCRPRPLSLLATTSNPSNLCETRAEAAPVLAGPKHKAVMERKAHHTVPTKSPEPLINAPTTSGDFALRRAQIRRKYYRPTDGRRQSANPEQPKPKSTHTKRAKGLRQLDDWLFPGATDVVPNSYPVLIPLRGLQKNRNMYARNGLPQFEPTNDALGDVTITKNGHLVRPHPPPLHALPDQRPNLVGTGADQDIVPLLASPTHGLRYTREERAAERTSMRHNARPRASQTILRGLRKNRATYGQQSSPPQNAYSRESASFQDEIQEEDMEALPLQDPPTTRALSNSGLVVAMPVLEQSSLNLLARAEQVDPTRLEQHANQQQKERLCQRIFYDIIFVSLIILVVSLGLSLGTRGDKVAQGQLNTTNAPNTNLTNLSQTSETLSPAPPKALDALLGDLPNSTVDNIFSAGTPQEKAYIWLDNHKHISSLPKWRMKQLFGLATFYFAFEGPNWFGGTKTDWLDEEKDECNWLSGEYSGFCIVGFDHLESYLKSSPCNAKGEIQILGFNCMGLEGLSPFLPPEIALLTSLNSIELSKNGIEMPFPEMLPTELHQLNNLTLLKLDRNYLAGQIPTELGMLTHLTDLDVHHNSLSGPIPSELGLISSLDYLSLYFNSLSGLVPTELALLSLAELGLSHNSLSGPIPIELAALLSLTEFDLSHNSLSGPIPIELAALRSLTDFDLSHNSLSAPIPSELGLLVSLSNMDLQNNFLTGPIPSELGLLTRLDTLFLNNNSLTSAITADLSSLQQMKSLQLHDNSLSGSLSSKIVLMSSLTYLALERNILTGTIPSELGLLSSLKKLWLHENALMGLIPSAIGLLSSIKGLAVNANSLSGQIPSELGKLRSLDYIYLQSNTLSGPIPSQLGMISFIKFLDLHSNSLSGHLPSEIGQFTKIFQFLDLHNNSLTGPIPSELGKLSELNELRLHNNSLSGTIPSELDQLVLDGSLVTLILEHNHLSGKVSGNLCRLRMFNPNTGYLGNGLGLSFECNEQLCGCCWCGCPGSETNASNASHCPLAGVYDPAKESDEWPGLFPNSSNAVAINIHTDDDPSDTYWEWSRQLEAGSWEVLDKEAYIWDPNILLSYTQVVEPNTSYRLEVFDMGWDGTCCIHGFGWFTITNATPSQDHANGTVIWNTTGDAYTSSIAVFIEVDASGNAQVQHIEARNNTGWSTFPWWLS